MSRGRLSFIFFISFCATSVLLGAVSKPFLSPFLASVDSPYSDPLAGVENEAFPLAELPTEISEHKELLTDIKKIPTPISLEQENLRRLRRNQILQDPLSRISKDFHIPSGLKRRTAFWFDIYTKYGAHHHVIHHTRYPWIVYAVVDTEDMILKGKGPLWLRRQRAQDHVVRERKRIESTLARLSRRESFNNLTREERTLFQKLNDLKGSRRSVLKLAKDNVRSQLGQRDFFQSGFKNSTRYLPYMEEIFVQNGLPIELTRMPFVESSFNELAVSKVGASGIWQIMPRTGLHYSMIVNSRIDERNSPLKATRAAARLLKDYYKSLGQSWPLTITSYNHGIGNIQKAIRAAKSRNIVEIIDRYHDGHFKFASSNFYTCFLAALFAEKYGDVLFEKTPRDPLLERESIRLTTRQHISSIIKMAGIDSKTFLLLNRDLREAIKHNHRLPRGFEIHLPPDARSRFEEQLMAMNRRQARQAN